MWESWETMIVYLICIVVMSVFGAVAMVLLFRRRKQETDLLYEAWMNSVRVQNEAWRAMIAEREVTFQLIGNYNQWMTHLATLVSNDASAKTKAFTDMSEQFTSKLVIAVGKAVKKVG